MRFPWILILALMAAAVPAGAQHKNKPVVKSSHEDKAAKGPGVKAPTARNSNSMELQRLEQQTAKSATGPKNSARQHVAPVKTAREKANPAIHFTSGTGGHGAGGGGSASSSKSRVRTKSSKH